MRAISGSVYGSVSYACAARAVVRPPGRLAEVEAAGQLAHDEHVDALDQVAAQRR